MKKIALLLALVGVAVVSVQAHAANWVPITKVGGMLIEADSTTIVRNAGITSVWIRALYERPERIANRDISKHLMRYRIRCVDKAMAVGQTIFYDTSGVAAHTVPEGPLVFEDAVPDSAMAKLVGLVCQ